MNQTTGAVWREDVSVAPGFRQFFRDWQPRVESARPILALHGSLTQSGMWRSLAEALHDVRMLCPDQRGFGLSADPGGDSCAEFAADAAALAGALLPERYVAMGHSFACSIALELARKHPEHVAAVVLVDPVVRTGAAPPPAPATKPPESFATLADAEQHFQSTEEGHWTPEALRQFTADVMIEAGANGPWRFPYTAERFRQLRAFTASAASDYGLFPKAKEVKCPVLVFRGGMSKRFAPAAEAPLLEAFGRPVELVVCPKSGHFPCSTEPQIMVDALRRFLADAPKEP